MKTHLLTGPLLLLSALGQTPGQSSFVPSNFLIRAQLVLVPVTVTDHDGKTLRGLQSKDFTIFDEGSRQQIISVSSEDAPCSAGIVLDTSGSMRTTLSTAKNVVDAFIRVANPQDEFMLATVSTQPPAVSEFTTDVAALEKHIQSARPGGLTALIDTIYLGLSQMREAKRPRRALLILSDGIDNHSEYSRRKLLQLAVEADVQIYTIIFDNTLTGGQAATVPFRPGMINKAVDQAPERQWPRMLEELAEKTGGLYFHVRTDAEAKDAGIKAGRALRNEYVIGYRPSESEAPGKWHKVRVKLHAREVNVYARDGY